MKKKLTILLLLMVSLGFSSKAQTKDSPWWLSLELATNKFDFSYYDGLFNFGEINSVGVRVGVERYLNPSFDLELGASYGGLVHEQIIDGMVTDLALRFAYKFNNGYLLKEESRFSPYLFLGYGLASYSKIEPIYEEYNDGTYQIVPFGLGLKYQVSDGLEINARGAFKNSISHSPNYAQYSLGVSMALSRNKDRDEDGVPNREDACPDEAGPAENMGCPWPDTDNDGVLDKDDECPTVAGTVNGCPDSDGDGVKDEDDECPNQAGTLNGCPDSDRDGVKDAEDGCPNQAGTLNGCLDSDGDGIKDSEDPCPNAAGNGNGCPDSDGDGIRDNEDKCPQTAGTNDGCPETNEETKSTIELAIKTINFALNSDKLNPSSYAALDQVARLMKENNFSLNIRGYADSTGPEDYNTWLSKLRARAVKQYLADKGVSQERLTVNALGTSNPVGDNSTKEGRAKNRRVELEIVYK